ncbi:probable ATP-dependent RNA helicase DDX28 [Artemia franciscana]
MPHNIQRRMKDNLKRKEKVQERHSERIEKIDSTNKVPLILCKNQSLNHYRGLNQHLRLEEITLASRAWTHRKATGDYFTILSSKGNPAFYDLGENNPRFFEDLPLNQELKDILTKRSLKVATNVQVLAIPEVLKGKNTLIAAETGSGKTLAYLLPVIQQILEMKAADPQLRVNRPLAIIVTPGRELAQQIFDVAEDLCRALPVKCNFVTGGSIARKITRPQYDEVDLLVGTLGGLSKLTTFGVYGTDMLAHVVIDEADTMLDDSFKDHTGRYLRRFSLQTENPTDENSVRTGAQVTLVGATVPKDLKNILADKLPIDALEEIRSPYTHRIMPNVTQKFLRIAMIKKGDVLLDLARQDFKKNLRTLIFSNKSETCDWINFYLNENGIPTYSISGKTPRDVRADAYERYRQGEGNVISCTDIASRGLDTLDVHHVINFDFPLNMSDYIHRVGRVGRVGAKVTGHVTSLVTKHHLEVDLVQKIEFTARKTADLPNVNANIKRIIAARLKKKGVETYLEDNENHTEKL